MNRDIILAGIPRSGTTLVCHLLNHMPNVVALNEPIKPYDIFGFNKNRITQFYSSLLKSLNIRNNLSIPNSLELISYLLYFYNEQRTSILTKGIARSKSKAGAIPCNSIGCLDEKTGSRKRIINGNSIVIEKKLTHNFSLLIKQPSLFSGLLNILNNQFLCFATIRNPLPILQSWNSVKMSVSEGHSPAAELYDQNLNNKLANESDLYNRQLILLSWFFEQFYNFLPAKNIIKYEETIATNGSNLAIIAPFVPTSVLKNKLVSKNNNPYYGNKLKNILAEKLLNSNGYYWKFYSKNDVVALLKT